MTKQLIQSIVKQLFGTLKISIPIISQSNQQVLQQYDFTNFDEYDIMAEIYQKFGSTKCIDLSADQQTLHQQCLKLLSQLDYINSKNKSVLQKLSTKQLFDKLIELIIEQKCIQPSFICNHPIFMSPLSLARKDNPLLAERFQVFVNKIEIINAYSQLNIADQQRERFCSQQQLKESKNQSMQLQYYEDEHVMDQQYIQALSYGMPPTAGWGMGIDRLVMLLCGVRNIREAILFPSFRSSLFKKKTK